MESLAIVVRDDPYDKLLTPFAFAFLQAGEILELIATDPATRSDIPSWCERTDNELLETESGNGQYRYLIRKTGWRTLPVSDRLWRITSIKKTGDGCIANNATVTGSVTNRSVR